MFNNKLNELLYTRNTGAKCKQSPIEPEEDSGYQIHAKQKRILTEACVIYTFTSIDQDHRCTINTGKLNNDEK